MFSLIENIIQKSEKFKKDGRAHGHHLIAVSNWIEMDYGSLNVCALLEVLGDMEERLAKLEKK